MLPADAKSLVGKMITTVPESLRRRLRKIAARMLQALRASKVRQDVMASAVSAVLRVLKGVRVPVAEMAEMAIRVRQVLRVLKDRQALRALTVRTARAVRYEALPILKATS